MSKTNSNFSFTNTVYTILNLFRYGLTTPAEIMEMYDIDKQELNYWLNKMCEDGIIKKIKRGIYSLTDSGKKIYDEYDHYKGKQMIRLENMRFSFRVIENEESIIKNMNWEKNYSLRNDVKVYQTHYDGHFVRLYQGKSVSLEISCEKRLDLDVNTLFLEATLDIVKVSNEISSKYKISISEHPLLTSRPEFAMAHPFSDALLQVMGASQITTDKGKMNQSKGRTPDWEPMDIHYAQKIVDMPNTLESIYDAVSELKFKINGFCPVIYRSWCL